MSTRTLSRRRRGRKGYAVQKPSGEFHPRVQKVGAEHFGIISVDCAKVRSKWMLCDFFGKPIVPPTEVEHQKPALDAAVVKIRQAMGDRDLKDLVVAIERTGRYHRVVQSAFAAAGWETRIVHPFATKQFRRAADPGNKTDDTDLAAIHRAAVNGLALREANLDESWHLLRLLERHRRDLVRKCTGLCCQIREHLDAALPGYAACFSTLWDSALAWLFVRRFASPAELLAVGLDGLRSLAQNADLRCQRGTLQKLLDWAAAAAPPEVGAGLRRRIALALYDDYQRKQQEIQAIECELAGRLAATPYILLLSFPGINVVSAAEFAGEMGPIANYASARHITGRAGLRPSRHQSDRVDRPNGPLVRCANRSLRFAIMTIADNLIACNQHFNVLFHRWKSAGADPRHTRVKVAHRFCRIAFQMVAGQQVFRHPCLQGRHYILDKLTHFHQTRDSSLAKLMPDLQAAIDQLPKKTYAEEAAPLHQRLEEIHARKRGPELLGNILPIVLARLGVGGVQSKASGETDLT